MNVRQLQHLAAAMAHEVRNPLNSMAIHLELLEGRLKRTAQGGELPLADREALLRSAKVLQSEIERVDKILESYLQFAGPEDTVRRPQPAVELIRAALGRARPRAERAGVKLNVDLKPLEALGDWLVDPEAFAEVIDALLSNAIEASPPGAVVELCGRRRDDEAEVLIVDHGEGISKENLSRIFQAGFSRRGKAGIGLAMAKQIVKTHAGSLTVASEGEGKGSTFTIRLPIDIGEEELGK